MRLELCTLTAPGYSLLGKRENASAVNFRIEAYRIRTGNVQSQAKIDGSGSCSGDTAGICAGPLEPF
jgi:hypothetical protein